MHNTGLLCPSMLHGIDELLYALFTVKNMVALRRGVCNCRHPAAFFVKWNTLREFFIPEQKQHPSDAMPADAFCRQIDFAGKSKPLTRQRFLIPCTGAYLAYLPQLELHSDRFVGTFTPFRIKSTPFRNGHLDSLFFFFYFTAFSRKMHELFLSI